ncbi:MAG: GGDEF domain-containing protein [Lachnospiraceae bacterium]
MKKKPLVILFLFIMFLYHFSSVTVYATATPMVESEFSTQESVYLQNEKKLRVSIITSEKPICYEDKDGTLQGLPKKILDSFAKKTNIALEYVQAHSYEEALEQLQTGKVDFIGMLSRYSDAASSSANSSDLTMVPYLTTQAVLIQHKNTELSSLQTLTLASVSGRKIQLINTHIREICYADSQECMNAVRCGQADATICDSFTAASLLQRYEAKDLISIPTNMKFEYGFGVLPQTDVKIISALQQSISSFAQEDITNILLQGSHYGSDNLLEFVYRYPFEIICFTVAIMFVFALSLTIYTKVKVRQHQALQGYEESYRLLSDTFGEAGLEYDYLNDSLTIFGQHSKLEIDQTVNDFTDKLQNKLIRIALTKEQWIQMINEGVEGNAFSSEFQCGVKTGEWVWYRLIYTVICTSESHRRPIRLVGCLANIAEEHAEKERLLQLSANDQLAGLLNHKTAEEKIGLLLENQELSYVGMMVVMDIDYFKQFNDQKGHLCGDDVLRTLGQTMRENFSSDDILSRWGGDEFLLFLPGKSYDIQNFTEAFNKIKEKMSAYQYQGESCPVTLSAGVAKSYSGCTFNMLFQQADDALYLAKHHGKNCFWLYSATEQKQTDDREGEQDES